MEKSSFFNSVNGDRKYKAEDFANFFNSLVTNGVFPNPSSNVQVLANNNMTVTIKVGKAWINGYCYYNDSDFVLPISVADGVLNRIDRVVLRLDTAGRAIKAVIKKGVFASTPIAKDLQRDADGFELGLADIYIGKGVTSISQVNITDLRMNTSLCGWVNSLIQADTTAIFNQFQAWYNTQTAKYQTDMDSTENQYKSDMVSKEQEFINQFNTWFNSVKGILGTDVAGNLQNEIDTLYTDNTKFTTVKSNKDSNGIFTAIQHKRKDGTLIEQSVLSGGETPNYTTRTVTKYAADGITIKETQVYTLNYDIDMALQSEVLQ